MHQVKHIYTCDVCGVVQEWASTHDVPMVRIAVEPGREYHWNFCSVECLGAWLKIHGFEVKE